MKKIVPFICLFFITKMSFSQSDLYDSNTIQEIRIYFEQTNWDEELDALYVAGEQERLLANITINGIALDSVGIRYKGFSSVSTDRAKNPFNIKIDHEKGNQDYQGITKIKLGNVIQDPSFLREILSYEIAQKYMPASQINYAQVYINDVYWGLYTNVESVEEPFLAKHFGDTGNPFFKCNPEDLDLDGDDNSNLDNSHGSDTTDYFPYYDMRSNAGWGDLYELIDVLNEAPEDIEDILNVDRTLWMHALNYVMINFDSYIGFAQNYYLYQDNNGQFNPILWDLNQSFASYRLTDASEHFEGFSIEQAKTMDPLLHWNSVSVYPRPLLRNLFENDTYRRMYIAHIRTIIEENFANQAYATRAQFLQDLIENAVLADTNKFYSNDDFYANSNTTVNDLVDYPGITDLMDARTDYLQNYEGYQGAPSISMITTSPQNLTLGGTLTLSAEVSNADNVILAYRFGGNGIFQKINLLDDGTQGDGAANDGIYGIQLANIGNAFHYYLYAENETAGRFSPERAAYEYYSLNTVSINADDVVINEFMASNSNTIFDDAGEYDDWIELYNTTTYDISTLGLYLSDDLEELQKWPLPEVSILADDYLLIWADKDEEQGHLHANFKLSGSGESIYLVNENAEILDSIAYEEQTEDVSFGRLPNGTGPFVELFPTPNKVNALVNAQQEAFDVEFTIFPNPVESILYLNFETKMPIQIQLFSLDGKLMKEQKGIDKERFTQMNVANLKNGIYYLHLQFEEGIRTKKIIIL